MPYRIAAGQPTVATVELTAVAVRAEVAAVHLIAANGFWFSYILRQCSLVLAHIYALQPVLADVAARNFVTAVMLFLLEETAFSLAQIEWIAQ